MSEKVAPTERELDILKVLWDRGEATVRDIYEQLRERLPIVQNTVQAFLRTMEEKGLVRHRLDGRTFIYRPTFEREQTTQHLTEQLLNRAFDGAIDQLVQSAFSLRQPTRDELDRLDQLLAQAKATKKRK
jgi:predicted transcriptional regulator